MDPSLNSSRREAARDGTNAGWNSQSESTFPNGVRVLFVLSSLNVGGLETWLVDLVRAIRKLHGTAIQLDFLTTLHQGGTYEPRLAEMGCNTFHLQLRYGRLPGFVSRLRAFLRRGRYDVVHAQDDYAAGLSMFAARWAGIPRRLFHVHSTRFAFGPDRPLRYRLAGKLLRASAVRFSQASLHCSRTARKAFFGDHWPPSARIYYCGIDLTLFQADPKACRASLRHELELPEESRLVLFAGRLSEEKNLPLLFKAMARLSALPHCVLVVAGDGPQRDALQRMASELGLADRCRFLGLRADLPRLMLASDVFVLPSRYEGLPLVLVQSQAAGLPIIASDAITREVVVVPKLFDWLSPQAAPETWASAIEQRLNAAIAADPAAALSAVRASPFDIETGAKELVTLYRQGLQDFAASETAGDRS